MLSHLWHRVLLSFLVCCCLCQLSSPSHAALGKQAFIGDGLVMNGDEQLLCYFRLFAAFNDEMVDGVESGIPLAFSFQLELHHHSPQGLVAIASHSFFHELNYNTLKQEYRFSSSRLADQVKTVTSLAEAQAMMTWVHDLPLIPLASLQPGQRYTVKVMASLARDRLPSRFQNVLGFVKSWDFSTDWHHITFTMPGHGP